MKNHLTEEQTRMLLEALRGHDLEAIITLAIATGARRDELLSLKWQDIDLEKREVQFLNSKTKQGYRVNRLPEEVTEVLKQHRVRQMEVQLEAGIARQNLDLVFPDRTGGFLESGQLLQGFREILAQAAFPSFRFHDLRAARWRALRLQLRSAKERLEGG